MYKALEGCPEEEQLGRFLVFANLSQRNGAGPVALLGAVGRGACLSNCPHVSLHAPRAIGGFVSVRLFPDSLRPPVLARPPRPPVLARPPREGRALSRLVGVFGAIAIGAMRSSAWGEGGASGSLRQRQRQ